MSRHLVFGLVLSILGAPLGAHAADPPPASAPAPAPAPAPAAAAEEAPKVQAIRAVERGVYVEGDIGMSFIVNKINDRKYGLGILTGVFAGYDFLPILSFSIGAYAMAASISRSSDQPSPQGDLLFVIPMAQLQFALITTERNFLFVRGGGGFAFGLPDKIDGAQYGGNGPAFTGQIGFERYTKLRHFSIGVLAGAMVVTKPDLGIGISVMPTLKYTF
jgi:hypothetical protein